jgi:hypothetical protein
MNYLSPTVRTGPWTEPEDRLLVQQVNVLGFMWSVIAHYFNGRSDNDVKNRWHSHLKYETVIDGGRYVLPADGVVRGRKKRNRAPAFPKANALRMLHQEQRRVMLGGMLEDKMKPVEDAHYNTQVITDVWDKLCAEEGAEEWGGEVDFTTFES